MNDQRTQKIEIPAALVRPAIQDRFEVLSVLGDGSAAFVYKVRDKQNDNKIVALKVLVHTKAFDGATIERFIDELRIAQSIKHPNVVEAYERIDVGDTIAFTMEFVNGIDLSRYLERGQRLTHEEIDLIIGQVLDGLSALHQNGVLHRDLKLENILYDEENRIAKISDLGLMKIAELEGYTRTGVLLGTASYFPPEYVRKFVYDERSDLWAVGIILYELITNRRRLQRLAGVDAIQHLSRTNFALPEGSLDGVSPRHLYVLSKALAIDPDHRFQSAAEMKQGLLHGEGAEAPPAKPVELRSQIVLKDLERSRPKRAPRSRRRAVQMLLGACAVSAVVIGVPLGSRLFKTVPLFPAGLYEGKTLKGTVRLTVSDTEAQLDASAFGCPLITVGSKPSEIVCQANRYLVSIALTEPGHDLVLTLQDSNGLETVVSKLKPK